MLRAYFIMTLLFSALAGTMFFGIVQAELSPPEFTVKLVAHPYDVPPTTTTTIDQYTGKEIVTTTPGYHVENKSIEITVTNQLFTPYADAEGHLINLYFNVRFKGHFGQESDWEEPFHKPIRNGIYGTTKQHPQSNSEYTLISFPSEFQDGDVVDFQVQTLEGFYTPWEPLLIPMGTSQFTGETSDWSSTQTLNIGEVQVPTPSPATTPTSTPTITPYQEPQPTEQEIIIGAAIVVAVIVAGLGLLIYLIKRK
jgi:hypothetical protein